MANSKELPKGEKTKYGKNAAALLLAGMLTASAVFGLSSCKEDKVNATPTPPAGVEETANQADDSEITEPAVIAGQDDLDTPDKSSEGEENEAWKISIDPVSGEEVNSGQGHPEKVDVENMSVFYGMGILLDRGMDYDVVEDIRFALTDYYSIHQIDDKAVDRISFSQALDHSISDDGNIYMVDIALNIDKMKKLTIVTNLNGLYSITVTSPDGSNKEIVYNAGG